MARRDERTMIQINWLGIAAAILLLAAGAGAASAYTLTLGNLNLAQTGVPGEIPLTLDSAPDGIAGYSLTFHITDPLEAEIVAVNLPGWAQDPDFFSVTPGTNDVTLVLADVTDAIGPTPVPPAGGFLLGTVVVQGVTPGASTGITVTVNQMDADNGAVVIPSVVAGTIDVVLPPGAISVSSTPVQGAQIYIDDVVVGNAVTNSVIPDVPVGLHRVKVSLAGWAEVTEQTVNVESGVTTPVTFNLVRPVTIIVKTVPSGADIILDGEPAGQTTDTGATFVRPPGMHTVSVSKTGYYGRSGSKNIIPPLTRWTFSWTLPLATNDVSPYGKIVVDSSPQDALIFVDGAYAGVNTRGFVETNPGKYMVYVTLDGYGRPEAQEATVVAQHDTNLMFTLEPALPVTVSVVPRTLNIANKGKFIAFVRLPDGYQAADVDAKSVSCNGAPAERLIRWKATPRVFGAIFSRGKLAGVEPGDPVTFTLLGDIRTGGETVPISGSDAIRVISSSGKAKEDTDGVEKMTDGQIYDKFKPKSL
jgi:hypothetical protein